LTPVSGTGVVVDRTFNLAAEPETFTFVHMPPHQWRLERPPGNPVLISAQHGDVDLRDDDSPQLYPPNTGWLAETASYALRPSLMGLTPDALLRVAPTSPISEDVVSTRSCVRVTINGGPTSTQYTLWVDVHEPLLLRFVAGSVWSPALASVFVELTRIRAITSNDVDDEAFDHELLRAAAERQRQERNTAINPPSTAVAQFLEWLRLVIPRDYTVRLLRWDAGTSEGQVLLDSSASHDGDGDILIDRRRHTRQPYEQARAQMIRTADSTGQWSVDGGRDVPPHIIGDIARTLINSGP
jgi:hypothetical protein